MEGLVIVFILAAFIIMYEFDGTWVVPTLGVPAFVAFIWLLNSLLGGV